MSKIKHNTFEENKNCTCKKCKSNYNNVGLTEEKDKNLKHQCECEDCKCEDCDCDCNCNCDCKDCSCGDHCGCGDCDCDDCDCDECKCDECDCDDCDCEDCGCGDECDCDECDGDEEHSHSKNEKSCKDGKCDCGKHDEFKHNEDDKISREISDETLYYLDLSQRLKADFENYKKRNSEISLNSYNNGIVYSVEQILPVIDTISRAKLNVTDEVILKGFEMINAQFIKSLEALGVSKIDCLGEKFDPNFHNAVMVDHNKKFKDEEVIEELQQGFMLKDKVIRHSVVKINKLS